MDTYNIRHAVELKHRYKAYNPRRHQKECQHCTPTNYRHRDTPLLVRKEQVTVWMEVWPVFTRASPPLWSTKKERAEDALKISFKKCYSQHIMWLQMDVTNWAKIQKYKNDILIKQCWLHFSISNKKITHWILLTYQVHWESEHGKWNCKSHLPTEII